mmetsp:Transcript_13860/g.2222  ORF Transcript_13860/g.2222 Transcript_13860/m.2222 type:complete len:88 (+) Transcript_13860:308-571(+)
MTLTQYKRYAKSQERKNQTEEPEDIEYLFWKNIRYNPPIYAADSQIQYSLFDKNNSWNLGKLDSYLSQGIQNFSLPGVTSPYIYVGC